jgi:hypothetical protein
MPESNGTRQIMQQNNRLPGIMPVKGGISQLVQINLEELVIGIHEL